MLDPPSGIELPNRKARQSRGGYLPAEEKRAPVGQQLRAPGVPRAHMHVLVGLHEQDHGGDVVVRELTGLFHQLSRARRGAAAQVVADDLRHGFVRHAVP